MRDSPVPSDRPVPSIYSLSDRVAPSLPAASTEGPDAADIWREFTAQLGREVAEPLSRALERVIHLATTGRISPDNLRLLRAEIERARRVGIASQQLARFTSKRLRQSHERLNLANTLQSVLAHRKREIAARGIHVKQSTRPIEVLVDPALLFSLLNAMLDWAVEVARSTIELRIDRNGWPAIGRLSCTFAHADADGTPAIAASADSLNSVNWHLVQQISQAMGLELLRDDDATRVKLELEFPRTITEELDGLSAIEFDHSDGSSLNSKPLAGSQVLVVAARREVRLQVRNAIAHMGLVLDFVASVDEAIDFCNGGLPHAIIFEGPLRGERLDQLAEEIRAELPNFSFIEIVEEGNTFEISGFNGMSHARVGRDSLQHSLPSALVFELTRSF